MAATREIHVLNKNVRLLQLEDGFWTSMDSVMLAAACPVKKGEHLLDMGCGVGGAGLCVLWREAQACLTGVDIQSDHVEIACQNAAQNEMEGRAEFICDDIRDYESSERFDHVICNPPYLEAGHHMVSPSVKKATAMGHGEVDLSVQAWVDAAFRNLKSKGSLTMIHRADAVDRIIRGFGKRFGEVEIIPLWPRKGAPAKRVIVRARKDRKGGAKIHAGLVLHEENGDYTTKANQILREGKAL